MYINLELWELFVLKRIRLVLIVLALALVGFVCSIRVCDDKPTLNYYSYESMNSMGWIESASNLKIFIFINLITCDEMDEHDPHNTGDNAYIYLHGKDGIVHNITISGECFEINDDSYRIRDSLWNTMLYLWMIFS